MESVGGPSGYSRGFTTDEFMTEAQLAQIQGKKIPRFGAALPPPHIALNDRTPTEFALSVHDTDPDHFKSTSAVDLDVINRAEVSEMPRKFPACCFMHCNDV